ncbi:alpha/beta fold hydrolase [Rhodococcus sp. C26F]
MTSAAYRVGAGEPVLLLHGFTLSHHVWHGVAHDLASDYDVLAMTMPGHGWRCSPATRPGWGMCSTTVSVRADVAIDRWIKETEGEHHE